MRKVDDAEEVQALFARSAQVAEPVDVHVKKFVFKLLSQTDGTGAGKLPVQAIWEKYFMMEEEQKQNA